MSDVQLAWDPLRSRADLVVSTGALAVDQDMVSAVVISLFTWRRAEPSDMMAPNDTDRRGWYGDTVFSGIHQGDRIGSRLWLLMRAISRDNDLLKTARDYCYQALQWMIDDGVAGKILVDTFFLGDDQSRLGIVITVYRDGQEPRPVQFEWAWGQLGIKG